MNILIVTAHPGKEGFAHRIARHYQKGAEKAGNQVEILDLYRSELKQGFLDFQDIKKSEPDPNREGVQAKISWAHELVFAFPLWWFGPPAILKNFFDQNFSSGFAYKYETIRGKGRLQRLLKGKTARIFITCDSPAWIFRLMMTPSMSLRWGTLFFCGVWTKSLTIFGRMRSAGERERERRLKKAERMGLRT